MVCRNIIRFDDINIQVQVVGLKSHDSALVTKKRKMKYKFLGEDERKSKLNLS